MQRPIAKPCLLFLAVLGVAARARGADIHVHPKGVNFSSCGAPSSPCRQIPYALSIASSGDRLLLANGVYCSSAIRIEKDITIEGTSLSETVIHSCDLGTVIDVRLVTVTLRDLSIAGGSARTECCPLGGGIANRGNLTLERVAVRDNRTVAGWGSGGAAGIYNRGTLVVEDSRIERNFADGTLIPAWMRGAGLFNDLFASATLRRTLVSGNRAEGRESLGAGIYSGEHATLVVEDSEIVDNSTGTGLPNAGAGLYNLGTASLRRVRLSRNRSGLGAGIYNGSSGVLDLVDVSVDANQAVGTALGGGSAGIENAGQLRAESSTISGNSCQDGLAGGLANRATGTGVLVNSTVSGNALESLAGAGGCFNEGRLDFFNVTIAANSLSSPLGPPQGAGGLTSVAPASAYLENTILGANLAPAASPDCFGDLTSRGHNLIGDPASCTLQAGMGDLVGIDPLLAPLGNYGGATDTHALFALSPARDAGNPAGCLDPGGQPLASDQRGEARAGCGRCDMGSYEARLLEVGLDALACEGDPVTLGGETGCGCAGATFQWHENGLPIGTPGPSPILVVQPLATASYRLDLVCAGGASASDDLLVTVLPAIVPAPGNALRATRVDGMLTLSRVFWDRPPTVTGTNLYQSDTEGVWPATPLLGFPEPSTLVPDASPLPRTTFWRIRAVSCAGNESL